MAQPLTLTGRNLTLEGLLQVVQGGKVAMAPGALSRARKSARVLKEEATERIMYGVNTGFGPMASRLIGKNDLESLQANLIRSHACGMGEPVADDYVIAAMTVRLNTLLRGDSGVSTALLDLLCALINARCTPLVPEHGGVGASGDLIQLSHIGLALLGEGEVRLKGVRMPAAQAFKKLKLQPHRFGPKEGLAVINGTSFMTAVAALVLVESRNVMSVALRAGALALEAASAFDDCLSPYLHAARPHTGQRDVAALLRTLTRGSKLLRARRQFERSEHLSETTLQLERMAQDVYSLRCTPQIAGPLVETLREAERVIEVELNSATDNPLINAQERAIVHGGNFHGEYVAHAMDKLKIAMTKLTMLSERRLNFFLHEKINGLFPPFLNLGTPGLTLGLQGLQFTAVSTTAQSQSLSYPHSLHSIPNNADNQDVVSMGADAALLAAKVTENAALVIAVELSALSQACAFEGREKKTGRAGQALIRRVRRFVPLVVEDRPLGVETQHLAGAVRRGEVLEPLGF